MSKTLSREEHSRKKSYVSETVIKICWGKIHIFFRLAAAALCELWHFFSLTTIPGYSKVGGNINTYW